MDRLGRVGPSVNASRGSILQEKSERSTLAPIRKKLSPSSNVIQQPVVQAFEKKFKPPAIVPALSALPQVPGKKRVLLPPQNWDEEAAKEHLRQKKREKRKRPGKKKEKNVFSVDTSAEPTVLVDADYKIPAALASTLLPVKEKVRYTDKYPVLVGQEAQLESMSQWLQNFQARTRFLPRALLLVGPSGTGKTTAARAQLIEAGYKIYEYSMDDHVEAKTMTVAAKRNGKKHKENYMILSEKGVEEVIYKLATRNSAFEKFAILLDGCGSMDSGTQKALADVISGAKFAKQFEKSSPQNVWLAPIVITVDAEEYGNVARLARECQVVEFSCPSLASLSLLVETVCAKENVALSDEVKSRLVEGCGGDVRRLLNGLEFLAVCNAKGVGDRDLSVIDVSSAFYNHASNFELFRHLYRKTHPRESSILDDLDNIMHAAPHPSLTGIIQENGPLLFQHDLDRHRDKKRLKFGHLGRVSIQVGATLVEEVAVLDKLADWEENVSLVAGLEHYIYKEHGNDNKILKATHTLLSTWGQTVTLPLVNVDNVQLEKSQLKSWEAKTKYRRSDMSSLSFPERGVNFIDIATLFSTMVSQYNEQNKGKKQVVDHVWNDEQLLQVAKEKRLTYKDLQCLWKCAHISEKTMPNPRGNKSLCKRIQE